MEDPLQALNPPAIVGEAVAGRLASVRRALKDIAGDISESTFDMAELLEEAQSGAYYTQWGFASLGDYAAQELGMKERKAQYLAHIVKVCKIVGLKRRDYEPAKVSKLRTITTLDPEGSYFSQETKQNEPLAEHIVRLVAEAVDMTGDQVETEVRRLLGQVGPDARVIRSYSITQSTWDNVVKPAQELARQLLGSQGKDDAGKAGEYSDGAVEEVIHQSFLNDENNYPEPKEEPTLPTEGDINV